MAAKKIEYLDEHRPHVTVPGIKSIHVIPTAMFHKMASGDLKAKDVDGIDDFLPTIISEWLLALQ